MKFHRRYAARHTRPGGVQPLVPAAAVAATIIAINVLAVGSSVIQGRQDRAAKARAALRQSGPLTTSPAPAPERSEGDGAAGEDQGGAAVVRQQPLIPVVASGTGSLYLMPGAGRVRGQGQLRRYRVEVEYGIGESPGAFAAIVERVLADPRSWGAGGRQSFQRVSAGPFDFRVILASPRLTDRFCAPLVTEGRYSCFQAGRSVVNDFRWRNGADAYAGDLAAYREYVVNHEVGHALGHDHLGCPGPGRPAPAMMQQTVGVGACTPNPWPFA